MKTTFLGFLMISLPLFLFAQDEISLADNSLLDNNHLNLPALDEPALGKPNPYRIYKKADIPITAIGAAWSAYAFTKIYNKPTSSVADVLSLNKDDINALDRVAAGNHSDDADRISNYPFYGSMPLPFLLFVDKHIRKNAGTVSFLYLETMAITGLVYTGAVYFSNRYRPETYNTDLPLPDRLNGNLRNSFLAGHPAVVAAATFFTAKMFSDYHPDSRLKWAFYGGAIAATGTTVYLRHVAGKHFPTDQIAGVTLGVLTGILVPHFHKVKPTQDQVWNLRPIYSNNGCGVAFTYRL